jgi:hypothetical protein
MNAPSQGFTIAESEEWKLPQVTSFSKRIRSGNAGEEYPTYTMRDGKEG